MAICKEVKFVSKFYQVPLKYKIIFFFFPFVMARDFQCKKQAPNLRLKFFEKLEFAFRDRKGN